MSVAEIKSQVDALSFDELTELSRHLRVLAWRKDPTRQAQLLAAEESQNWVSRAELECAVAELDREGR